MSILGWQPLAGNTDTAEFHIRRNILDNQKHVSVQILDTQGNARISVRHLPYHIPREKNPILEPEIVVESNKDQGKQPPKLGLSVTHKRITSWASVETQITTSSFNSLPLIPIALPSFGKTSRSTEKRS